MPSFRLYLLLITLLAAAARLAGSWNDLWLDEIWSIEMVRRIESPLQILTYLTHDNNHPLNSLLIWILLPIHSAWLFRLPALLAGVATAPLAAWAIAGTFPDATDRRRGGILAALLAGFSYPLVLYGSEARGYSLSLAFGLACIGFTLRRQEHSRAAAPLHWLLFALALLAHATAVNLLLGLIAWSIARILTAPNPIERKSRLLAALWWQGIPALLTAAFYWIFLRNISLGGGGSFESEPMMLVQHRAIAMSLGLPPALPTFLTLLIGIALLAWGLIGLARRCGEMAVFFAVSILLAPAAMKVINPGFVFERYFLWNLLLGLLLLVHPLIALWQAGGWRRMVVTLTVTLFLTGSAVPFVSLCRFGRGQATDALKLIAAQSAGQPVLITGRERPALASPLSYYTAHDPRFASIRYVEPTSPQADQARWYVMSIDWTGGDQTPPGQLRSPGGIVYDYVAHLPTAPLSGVHWFLFRR